MTNDASDRLQNALNERVGAQVRPTRGAAGFVNIELHDEPGRPGESKKEEPEEGLTLIAIEPTREVVSEIYERLDNNLQIVRSVQDRPLTLADKILLSHLDDPATTGMVRGQTYVQLRPDRVILQDVLGQTAMLQFMQTRRATTAVPTSVHCDHLIQARVEGSRDLSESLAENDEVYNFLRTASAKYGVGFWSPGAGSSTRWPSRITRSLPK